MIANKWQITPADCLRDGRVPTFADKKIKRVLIRNALKITY